MKQVASISRIKPGGLILIDEVPCKIDKIQASTSGKHGHAKIRVDAVGILDGKHRSMVKPSGENIDVPILNKMTAQVLAVNGDTAQLMDTTSFEMFDLPIPEELKGKLEVGGETMYYEVMGTKTLEQLK